MTHQNSVSFLLPPCVSFPLLSIQHVIFTLGMGRVKELNNSIVQLFSFSTPLFLFWQQCRFNGLQVLSQNLFKWLFEVSIWMQWLFSGFDENTWGKIPINEQPDKIPSTIFPNFQRALECMNNCPLFSNVPQLEIYLILLPFSEMEKNLLDGILENIVGFFLMLHAI